MSVVSVLSVVRVFVPSDGLQTHPTNPPPGPLPLEGGVGSRSRSRKCLICRVFWRCRFDGFLRVLVDENLSFRSPRAASESVFVRYANCDIGVAGVGVGVRRRSVAIGA